MGWYECGEGENGGRRGCIGWVGDGKGQEGCVLLYLTSAGSMASAEAVVSRCWCSRAGGRTAMVVACHAGGKD